MGPTKKVKLRHSGYYQTPFLAPHPFPCHMQVLNKGWCSKHVFPCMYV